MRGLSAISIAAILFCTYFTPATLAATPATTVELYFRRTILDPFTDPGYRETVDGTAFATLSHTSPTGSTARFTADAANGTLRGFADAVNASSVTGFAGDEAWAHGSVNDSFTVNAATPGTHLSITARFTVDGTLAGTGGLPQTIQTQENAALITQFTVLNHNEDFTQWARTEAEMADTWLHGGGAFFVPIHRVTEYQLDIVAGTPFDIFYMLDVRGGWAYGGSGGTADFGGTGALSFELPIGTTITSAGGFIQSNIPEPAIFALIGLTSALCVRQHRR